MRRPLFPLLFVLMSTAASAQGPVDQVQADAMVKLLESCARGEVRQEAVGRVMALPGTQLIVAQQNISRRITSAQYRAVLISACKGEIAHIEPSEPGARAEKGVQGLTNDVAPSLIWGRDHLDFLKKRLAIAQETKGFGEVVPLALRNLPENVALSPKLYFVMGGRAGAAAFDEGV